MTRGATPFKVSEAKNYDSSIETYPSAKNYDSIRTISICQKLTAAKQNPSARFGNLHQRDNFGSSGSSLLEQIITCVSAGVVDP